MSASETTEKIRAVILYDCLDSAGRALAAYENLILALDSESPPELSLWRLDVATSPEFAVKADYDIASAEIVLMSVRGGEPCPPVFQHWHERAWQDECAPRRIWIAIVVAADSPANVTETWTSTLRRAATQIHPEIFVWEPVSEFTAAQPKPRVSVQQLAAVAGTIEPEASHVGVFQHERDSSEPGLMPAHRE